MNRNMRKRTFWHVRPTKTQIRSRIRTVWSEFIDRVKRLCILDYPKCARWRFRSDCANAQSDLNLRWAHMSEGTFSNITADVFFMTSSGTSVYIKQRSMYYWKNEREETLNIHGAETGLEPTLRRSACWDTLGCNVCNYYRVLVKIAIQS